MSKIYLCPSCGSIMVGIDDGYKCTQFECKLSLTVSETEKHAVEVDRTGKPVTK